MTRTELLNKANEIVTGHRESDYGSPEDSLKDISELWTAYLDRIVTSQDVAILMTLLKIARLKNNPDHIDSAIDAAGYISLIAPYLPDPAKQEQWRKELKEEWGKPSKVKVYDYGANESDIPKERWVPKERIPGTQEWYNKQILQRITCKHIKSVNHIQSHEGRREFTYTVDTDEGEAIRIFTYDSDVCEDLKHVMDVIENWYEGAKE